MNSRSYIAAALSVGILAILAITPWFTKGFRDTAPQSSTSTLPAVSESINTNIATSSSTTSPATMTKAAKTTAKASALPPIPDCGNNYVCFQAYYEGLVKNFGVAKTYEQIKKQFDTDPYVHSECHALTHIIGRAAAGLYSNIAEAFAHGDEFCASGYYHGVMEAVISKMGRKNVPDQLNQICAEIPGKERHSLEYYNCNHGMGHGLMDLTEDELFDSLALCDKLTGDWEASSCYGGVFMENVVTDFRNHTTKYLHPEDPMYPCNAVGDKYKQSCYINQSSYALKLLGGDFKKTFEACGQIEENYKATCFQSIGRDASGWSASDVAITKARCEMGKDYFEQSNCVIGAAKDFVWHYHSYTEGSKLCDALNPDLQDICRTTAKDYYDAF